MPPTDDPDPAAPGADAPPAAVPHAAEAAAAPANAPEAGPLGFAAAVAVRARTLADERAAAEAQLRAGPSPEALHALRVALRRLRSLVRACRDLWPQEAIRLALAHLAETSRRCGEARDLDVGLAALRLEADALPEPLRAGAGAALAWAESERAAAAQRLHEWLAAPDRLAAEAACDAALAAMDPTAAAAARPAGDEVAARAAAAAHSLRRRIRAIDAGLPTPDVHELRITGKRLRYLVEAFADGVLPVRAKALARLVRLQHAIGDVCDHENALARLLAWLRPAAAAADDGAMAAAAIGALAARHGRAAQKARKAARAAIARIDRRGFWRAFGGDAAPTDANLSA